MQHQCVRWLMPVPWICRLLAHSVAYAPAVRLRRAEAALRNRSPYWHRFRNERTATEAKKKNNRKRPRRSRFSIGSASPWRASHFLKLSSLGLGETRCGFRITAVSVGQPPPAASTFPPYRLPDTLPPFSLAGLVALSHSSRAFLLCGISGDLGSSLQAWL